MPLMAFEIFLALRFFLGVALGLGTSPIDDSEVDRGGRSVVTLVEQAPGVADRNVGDEGWSRPDAAASSRSDGQNYEQGAEGDDPISGAPSVESGALVRALRFSGRFLRAPSSPPSVEFAQARSLLLLLGLRIRGPPH